MADLICDEVLTVEQETSEHLQTENEMSNMDNLEDHQENVDMSQFCCAYKDRAILEDSRVLQNMLELEEFYMPSPNLYEEMQDEIRIHMRKIVTEWMLDVCLDSRCHVDVFLLATNIMDRFLATIRLQKKQFQLLGAASIFLASKMIEPQPISALTLVRNTADTYDREELLSMELLILSKLKWDLTAITSYDYLDYMINDTITPKVSQPILITSTPNPTTLVQTNNSSKLLEQQNSSSQLESKVRRNTEKLVTLCATDETFMSMPPSLVAASALVTAIEQDPTVTNNFNLNQIVNNIRDLTKLEISTMKNCMHLIERIFLQNNTTSTTQSNSGTDFNYDQQGAGQQQNNPGNSNVVVGVTGTLVGPHPQIYAQHNRSRNYRSDTSSNLTTSDDQTTPTEVFSVSALYVT